MLRALIAACAALLPLTVWAETPSYLRLIDRLDRPQDGYCVDVLGSGGAFRVDMPLMAHNCKPGAAPDEVLMLRADGTLFFPAYDACVTAMGVNTSLLPGAALMLKRCGANLPFLPAANFQQFSLQPDGRMVVEPHGLCLAVSGQSDRTFSPRDVWRALYVTDCDGADPRLSRWELIVPY